MDGWISMLTDTALPLHDHTARTENAVLQKKVKELTAELKLLRVENQSLKAEVEIYYGLQITCRFFRTKRVRRLSNRNVVVHFSLFSLPIP